jgi:hypothetical protein
VIFIIDVSGSMNDGPVEVVGKEGLPRITVAQRERSAASTGSTTRACSTSSPSRAASITGPRRVGFEELARQAKLWIKPARRRRQDQLYGAIRRPCGSDVGDLHPFRGGRGRRGRRSSTIREHVRLWNENRRVEINTIAVGGRFAI